MSSVDPQLLYFCSRLSGYSTNNFRLETVNKGEAVPNSIVTLDLPANSLVDLRSLVLHMNVEISATEGAGIRLPPLRELVERVEVSMGGIVLSQGANGINTFTALRDSVMQKDVTYTPLNHDCIVRNVTPDGRLIKTDDNEVYVPNGKTLFALRLADIPGFLETFEPRILDTSLVPDCRLRLYMASSTALCVGKVIDPDQGAMFKDPLQLPDLTNFGIPAARGYYDNNEKSVFVWSRPTYNPEEHTPATQIPLPASYIYSGPFIETIDIANNVSYKCTDLHATVECLSYADTSYESVVSQTLSRNGFLEGVYKNYHMFSDTHGGTTRFSLATQSLDRVWVAWRTGDFDKLSPVIAEQFGSKISAQCMTSLKLPMTVNVTGDNKITDPNGVNNAAGDIANTQKIPELALQEQTSFKTRATNFLMPQSAKYHVLDSTAPKKSLEQNPLPFTMQLSINGAMVPQYNATPSELLAMTINSLPHPELAKPQTMASYLQNNFVQCVRLNQRGSEDSRLISGLDTRATNLAAFVKTVGQKIAATSSNCLVYCETTSSLRIGAGRAIEVIL